MKISAATAIFTAAALPALFNAQSIDDMGVEIPSGGEAGLDSAGSSENCMEELELLNVGDMDGIKEFDGFKNYGALVAQAVASNADQTFCPVGMTVAVGGNMGEMSLQEGGSKFEAGVSIAATVVPCGIPLLDPSPYLLAAAGAMGFDEINACVGNDCKCGALQVKTGVTMKFDFQALLDSENGAGLRVLGITSFDELLEYADNQAGGANIPEEAKAQMDEAMKLMKDGIAISTTMDVLACVSENSPAETNSQFKIASPGLALDSAAMLDAGFEVTMETTAALTVTDPEPREEIQVNAEVWFTTADGHSISVTVVAVNDEVTVIHDVQMPAGSTCKVLIGDEEVDVAVAGLTTSAEMAALEASGPTAPANKVADEANSMGNSAATASTGLFASAAALFAALTLTR